MNCKDLKKRTTLVKCELVATNHELFTDQWIPSHTYAILSVDPMKKFEIVVNILTESLRFNGKEEVT